MKIKKTILVLTILITGCSATLQSRTSSTVYDLGLIRSEDSSSIVRMPTWVSLMVADAVWGAFLPENANAGRNVKVDGFRVVVQGEAGKRYDIEATETPGVLSSWLPVATNLDGAALVDFTDPVVTSRPARFYRVIER